MIESVIAGGLQLVQRAFLDPAQALVKVRDDFPREILFIHKRTLFSCNTAASAWVAREQCVFTLPSEQPITAAASATSISSQ